MALWQIKLGENNPDWREVKLATEHSIVTIDFAIKEDIRNMDDEKIKAYIEKVNEVFQTKPGAVRLYIKQILSFKNDIKEGNYMISPFKNLGGGDKYRIGKFVGEMGTLESLFEGDLAAYLAEHAYIKRLDKNLTIDDCRNIPARKVEWLSDLFHKSNLNSKIEPKENTGDRIGTVAKLKFDGEIPYGLVPKDIFLKYPIHRKIEKITKSWFTLPRIAAIATIIGVVIVALEYFS